MGIVAKFGGSSIPTAEHIRNALTIVKKRLASGVVLVASAMGDTTDRLVEIVDVCAEGHRAHGLALLNKLRERHLSELESITDHYIRLHGVKRIELLCDEMQAVCIEIAVQKMATNPQRAYLLAHGELLATTVIYALARWDTLECELLDSREFIATDNQALKAEVEWDITEQRIKKQIDLKAGTLYIAQGFIACSLDGRTTTLGRGGSDYSASLIGAALGVERIEIWTDVNGILTVDPRIVRSAIPVRKLSYEEAAELSYFGATVLHPSTMIPAIKQDIPIVVRNTHNPTHPGTEIGKQPKRAGARAIAMKHGITVINIQSYRMLNAYGFLGRIFSIFADYQTVVDLVTTSEVSVSLTIEDNHNLEHIADELRRFAKVDIKEERSIVSIVAQDLWRDASAVTRAFRALDGIPLELVSLGGSDTNLSLVIERGEVARAVQALHSALFE